MLGAAAWMRQTNPHRCRTLNGKQVYIKQAYFQNKLMFKKFIFKTGLYSARFELRFGLLSNPPAHNLLSLAAKDTK